MKNRVIYYYFDIMNVSNMLNFGYSMIESIFWNCKSCCSKYKCSNKSQICSLCKPCVMKSHFHFCLFLIISNLINLIIMNVK